MLEELMKKYENQLYQCKEEFRFNSESLKKSLAKKISNNIEEELYRLKGVRVIADNIYLMERIENNFDKIISEYDKVISRNKEKQEHQLSDLYKGMPIEQMDGIRYEEIKYDDSFIENMTRKIVDDVITHINYENTNNGMYFQKVRQVEEIVKSEITKDKIKTSIQEFDKLYNDIIDKMIHQNNEFRNNYFEEQHKQENPQQENLRTEIKDGKLYTYDGDFIDSISNLDDTNESENAKRFK